MLGYKVPFEYVNCFDYDYVYCNNQGLFSMYCNAFFFIYSSNYQNIMKYNNAAIKSRAFETQKSTFVRVVILDHFLANNAKSETMFLSLFLSKECYCNTFFFPRTFVSLSNKTFTKNTFGGDRQTNKHTNNGLCNF